jgi:hypothetical protein
MKHMFALALAALSLDAATASPLNLEPRQGVGLPIPPMPNPKTLHIT